MTAPPSRQDPGTPTRVLQVTPGAPGRRAWALRPANAEKVPVARIAAMSSVSSERRCALREGTVAHFFSPGGFVRDPGDGPRGRDSIGDSKLEAASPSGQDVPAGWAMPQQRCPCRVPKPCLSLAVTLTWL